MEVIYKVTTPDGLSTDVLDTTILPITERKDRKDELTRQGK